MSTYRDELVQVAAVAIAMLTDHDWGHTYPQGEVLTDQILADIRAERDRQEAIWGNRHQSELEWLSILVEEVGEVAKVIIEEIHPWPAPKATRARIRADKVDPLLDAVELAFYKPLSLHGEIDQHIGKVRATFGEPQKITVSRLAAQELSLEILYGTAGDDELLTDSEEAVSELIRRMGLPGGTIFGIPFQLDPELEGRTWLIELPSGTTLPDGQTIRFSAP